MLFIGVPAVTEQMCREFIQGNKASGSIKTQSAAQSTLKGEKPEYERDFGKRQVADLRVDSPTRYNS